MKKRQNTGYKPGWLLYGLLSLLIVAAVFSVYALGGFGNPLAPAWADDNPPVDDPPVDDPPVDDPPVEDPPVDDPPIVDPPVEDPPVEDPPVEDPPVEDPPVEDPPVEDPPVEDPPVEDPPVDDPVIEEEEELPLVMTLAQPLAIPIMPTALLAMPINIGFSVDWISYDTLEFTVDIIDIPTSSITNIDFELVVGGDTFTLATSSQYYLNVGDSFTITDYPTVLDIMQAMDTLNDFGCTLNYSIDMAGNTYAGSCVVPAIGNVVAGSLGVKDVSANGATFYWKDLSLSGAGSSGFGGIGDELALVLSAEHEKYYHQLYAMINDLPSGELRLPAFVYDSAKHNSEHFHGILDPSLASGNPPANGLWLASGGEYYVQLEYFQSSPVVEPFSFSLFSAGESLSSKYYVSSRLSLAEPVELVNKTPTPNPNPDRDRDGNGGNDSQTQTDLPYTPLDEDAEVTKEGSVTTLTHNEDGKAVLTTTLADYPIEKAQEDGYTTLVIDLTKHLDMVDDDELGDLIQRLVFPQNAFDALDDNTVITIRSNNMEITLTVGELKRGETGNMSLEIEFYETGNIPGSGAAETISVVTDIERFGLPVYFAARGQNAPLFMARQVQANTRRVASNAFNISVSQVNAAGAKTAVNTFNDKPVTVNIPISSVKPAVAGSPNTAGRSSYVVKKYNDQTNSWETRPTVVTAQRVSFSSRTLSTFAIFETEIDAADVDSSYEYAYVLAFLVENGIVKGTDEGNVEPYRDITLAELAALLARLDNRALATNNAVYPDVSPDKWYYAELNTALARGYITEQESWRNPEDALPLHYVAQMLFRYYNSQLDMPVVLEDERQAALDFAAEAGLFTPLLLQDIDQPLNRENIFIAIYNLFLRLMGLEIV